MEEKELNCRYCGKRLLPDMIFCPYCGKTIGSEKEDTQDIPVSREDSRENEEHSDKCLGESFVLTFDSAVIRYPHDMQTYTEFLGKMQEKVILLTDRFLSNYSKYGTFIGLMELAKKDLEECADEMVALAVDECRKAGLGWVDKSSFFSAYYIIEKLFQKLEEAPTLLHSQMEAEQEARELDRMTRGHVMGGGFGLGGAVKGMMLAGVMNYFYDIYRDSKFLDEDGVRRKLNEITHSENVKKAVAATINAVASVIFELTVFNYRKLKPFQNMDDAAGAEAVKKLVAGIDDAAGKRDVILSALGNAPEEEEVYRFFDDILLKDASVTASVAEDCQKFADIFGHTKQQGIEYVITARVRGDSDASIARWIKYYLATGKPALLAKADALYNDAVDADKKYFPDALKIVEGLIKANYSPAYVYLAKNTKLRNKSTYSLIALYSKAAALEDKDGLFELGKCYKNGYLVPENEKKAKELFVSAAKFGQKQAIEEVKDLYFKGRIEKTPEIENIVQQYDPDEMLRKVQAIFREHSAGGKIDLNGLTKEELMDLADAYKNGVGTNKDLQKAADCYAYAANKGLAIALFKLSNLIDNGMKVRADLSPAIRKLIYQSNQNFLEKIQDSYSPYLASLLLVWGIVYLYGLGEKTDFNKALHFFQEGQKTEYVNQRQECVSRADYVRGLLQEEKKDFAGAFQYFNKSSDNRYLPAFYKIAEYCFEGKGIPQNIEISAQLFKELSEMPILDSLAWKHYVDSKLSDSKQEYQTAFQELKKAVEAGHQKAIVDLGYYFETGKGTEVNFVRAVECYNKAYNSGLPEAAYRLGLYCKNVCNDDVNAKAWFEIYNQMKKNS